MKHQIINFIRRSLNDAGNIARQKFDKVTNISTKKHDNNQVLTQADLEIGNYLIDQIKNEFPKHNIIDEEVGVIDNGSDYTWVIDPIDGTSNFANGLSTYGIMIGLLQGSSAVAGGIMLPFFAELFYAYQGSGAFCNEKKIQVSQQPRLLHSLVAYGIDGHQNDTTRTENEAKLLGKIILNIRNLRTTNSAYDMAKTAEGRYGLYLNQTTKICDNVALQPIIEEAGGEVTDFWGNPMDYSSPLEKSEQNFTICAGAKQLHKQIQNIIHVKSQEN